MDRWLAILIQGGKMSVLFSAYSEISVYDYLNNYKNTQGLPDILPKGLILVVSGKTYQDN